MAAGPAVAAAIDKLHAWQHESYQKVRDTSGSSTDEQQIKQDRLRIKLLFDARAPQPSACLNGVQLTTSPHLRSRVRFLRQTGTVAGFMPW